MPIRKFTAGNTTFLTSPAVKLQGPAWQVFKAENVKVVINCMDNLGLAGQPTPVPYVSANIIETEKWGYIPFYLALQAVQRFGQPAVFHCRAGITRSVTVAAAVLEALEGQIPKNQVERTGKKWNTKRFKGKAKLDIAIARKRVPSDIREFLKLQLQMPGKSACQVLNALHQV